MLVTKKYNFIIVDDNKLDSFIAEKIIKNTGKCNQVKTFHYGKEAIDFLASNQKPEHLSTIILVDIMMPIMSGFEFVEEFEKLPEEVKAGSSIYVMSSSISERDLNLVHNYSSVKQYLNKPLNSNNLALLLN